MSTTGLELDNVIDFHQKRREIVIEKIIKTNRMSKDAIENIIEMHNFLTQTDYNIQNNLIDQNTIDKIEDETSLVREKFDELFEMIKGELFIRDHWRTY